ncbi:MAG: hypothetical protein ACJ8BW_19140 [Ktedonobacteraceae bacterium]
MQRPVRVVPCAVRVVGPRRVGFPPIERQPGVVAVVDRVPRVVRVRRTRADLDVRGERLSTICAERPPKLSVIVRHAIGITWATGTKVFPGVVPHHCEVPGGWIERDLRQELAVLRVVVVYPRRAAPCSTVVIREADVDVCVVALVRVLERVHQVHAPIVGSTRPIPGKPRLRVD